MNNTIDLSKLPISPNSEIKNVVAINNDGDVIVAENYTQTDIESDYYNKQEVNNLVADKITETDLGIALASYVTDADLSTTLNNYVTNSELFNYYTKSEIDEMIGFASAIINDINDLVV